MSPSAPMEPRPTSHPPELTARVGRQVGEWRVGPILGVGGMACVYAVDNGTGDEAALKVVHPQELLNPEGLERFTREARILELLAGRRAALRFFGAGTTEEGHPFVVIERLRGQDLAQRRKSLGRRFSIQEAVEICDPILELLEFCHGQEIVHRDLKPSNVFLCEDGAVKVLDFGVARTRSQPTAPAGAPLVPLALEEAREQSVAEHTRAGIAVGTAAYMAPEQAIGRSDLTDGRADVFAVGAMIYHLVSGVPLRHGRKFEEIFVQAATAQVPSLARVAPDLSPEVVHAVDRALAWDPRERYPTARDMRAALRAVLQLKPAVERPLSANLGGSLPVPLAELAHDVEAAPIQQEEALIALREVLRAMEVAMNTARRYGWTHAECERRFEACAERVDQALRTSDGLEWQVKPTSFVQGEEVVWEPGAAFESVPYNLFAGGIHYLQLGRGLTREELRRFLQFLMLDPIRDLNQEDDLGVRLWEMGSKHLKFQLVSGFEFVETEENTAAAEDFAETETETRELTRLLMASGQGAMTEASSMQVGLAPVLSRGAAPGLYAPLTDEGRAPLARLFTRGEESIGRLGDVLVRALEEGHRGQDLTGLAPFLEDLVPTFLQAGHLKPLFELLGFVLEALQKEPELKRFFVERALPPGPAGMFIDALASLARAGQEPEIAGVTQLLASIGSAVVVPALALAPRTTGAFHDQLVGFLFDQAGSFSAQVGDALTNATPEFGGVLLRILGAHRSQDTRDHVRRAAENPSLELRLSALALLVELEPNDIAGDITPYLEHPDPGIRIRVLRLLLPSVDPALVEPLERRIGSDGFEGLPHVERRLLLETLQRLSPPRAERALVKILAQRESLTRGTAQLNTRMLAIQLLAQWAETEEALALLEAVAQAKWGSDPEVRKRAASAAEHLRQRRSGRAP